MEEQELLALYDQYADMVYRLALAHLHCRADAEDAVQAVFLKLIEGRTTPFPGKEKALLAQITVNYCRDELRAVRRKDMPLDEFIVFEDKSDQEFFAVVMELPEKYRAAIHLHFFEGYSFPETGKILNISPSAVSMRIHRAKRILKKQLGRDDK